MTDRMDIEQTKLMHDVLNTLTELRKRTGVNIGDYDNPQIRIGSDGIAFRLVWDNDTDVYVLEETYR